MGQFYTEKFTYENCWESIFYEIEELEHENEIYF